MEKEFERLITPVDGSESSIRAARKAIYLAKKMGADIIALYVLHLPISAYVGPPYSPVIYTDDIEIKELRKKMKNEGNQVLDKIEKMALEEGIKIAKKIVEGSPDEEIIKISKKDDLIVMGAKGISAIDRIFLGSVSEKVLHHAKSSVMIVR
ncbi:MAG TPA: universal stress protein [Methanofastidiosum sp.]|jgi:nucleotide-binding universal stress UspA family protein|nr:universal stress protein [Methanofastidiosum sp.]HPA49167.1 universal stress protein [Methanofastidiosum sp.]HQK62423.1 universal stress protein [Methanofastidiosum sp.]HQM94626.1 universal stress protein [Methanofastidiosum sp.]HQQ48625.1 universal stress protein [Methanofastidiosum sp.]